MYAKWTPASQVLDPSRWPIDFLQSDRGDSLLDSIYVVDSSVVVGATSLAFSIRVVFEGELALSIPGLDAVTLVLGVPVEEPPPPEPETDFAFDPGLGEGWTEVALALEAGTAGWTLTLRDVAFELRVAAGLLRPVDGGEQVRIALRGDIAIDDTFEVSVSGFDAFDVGACEIGQSGLILAATGVALDLARLASPPEVLQAGFDKSFLGAYLGTATV